MTVLVVDDERDVEPLFRQRFRKETRAGDLALAFAFSGDEALGFLAEHRADVVLVLSDVNMPGMSGLDLLARIKATPPPLPVCLMTAYDDDAHRRDAADRGADGYLTKPVDFDVLRSRLAALRQESH